MNLKDLKTILLNIVIPFIVVVLIFFICDRFNSFVPYFALLPLLGLTAGPYGAIVGALSIGILDFSYDIPFIVLMVDMITAFICSYFPYRLWYSFNKDNKFISLDSSYNLLKLIGVLLASTIFFTYESIIIYANYDFVNLTSYFVINNDFLILAILNYFNLGLLFLIIVLLIASYFNLTFYFPGKISFNYFESLSKYFEDVKFLNYIKNSKFFDNLLAIWIIISFILLFIYIVLGAVPYYLPISIIMSILAIIIMFKPIKTYNNKSTNQKFNLIKDLFDSSENFKSFSLNEIFMVIFVMFILGMIIFLLILYEFGLLNVIPGLRHVSSFLIYLGLVLLFLIIFSFVLVYFENRVSIPLNRISVILDNYFKGKTLSKEDNEYLENIPNLFNRETEISSLSRVLSKMNKDIDEYKDNIKDLTLEKEKIEAELAIAHNIQDSFLPKEFDLHEDLDIFGLMVPAKSVGGDFYDFFKIDENHFAFLIGDVSDKGVPAALFMVKSIQLIKSKLISSYSRDINLEDIIEDVNNELCLNNESCMFVTSWIGVIDLEHDKLTYVNAGHEFPLFKSNNKCNVLKSENDLVLGVMEDTEFHAHELDLNKSDRILLFTDGVTDANNINKEFFGVNRLFKVFENDDSSVKDTINNIKKSSDKFTENQEQFDDFTVLLLEYKS